MKGRIAVSVSQPIYVYPLLKIAIIFHFQSFKWTFTTVVYALYMVASSWLSKLYVVILFWSSFYLQTCSSFCARYRSHDRSIWLWFTKWAKCAEKDLKSMNLLRLYFFSIPVECSHVWAFKFEHICKMDPHCIGGFLRRKDVPPLVVVSKALFLSTWLVYICWKKAGNLLR